jgi:hypothetical protein
LLEESYNLLFKFIFTVRTEIKGSEVFGTLVDVPWRNKYEVGIPDRKTTFGIIPFASIT